MTPRCAAFIASSLDGYIARSDGNIDWLDAANRSVTPGVDCGYGEFMADVDALVMGRNTFEKVLSFQTWPYGSTRVIVLSRSALTLPQDTPAGVSLSNEGPRALVERLSEQGVRKLYIDGGLTIQSFLAEGLLDEITVTVVPILLGSGRPLFGPLPADVHLAHDGTTAFDFGFVQSRYRVVSRA